jgi:hypothetical protein
MKKSIVFFWVVMPCGPEDGYHHSSRMLAEDHSPQSNLHHHDSQISEDFKNITTIGEQNFLVTK